MEYITLANGYQLPMLGYGTLHIPPKQTKECVLKAFEAGYRLIDTAASYQNEKEIGIQFSNDNYMTSRANFSYFELY